MMLRSALAVFRPKGASLALVLAFLSLCLDGTATGAVPVPGTNGADGTAAFENRTDANAAESNASIGNGAATNMAAADTAAADAAESLKQLSPKDRIAAITGATSTAERAALATAASSAAGQQADTLRLSGIAFIIILLGGAVWILVMQHGVREAAAAAKDGAAGVIEKFPMGVPPGTVRSVLALAILAVGLWLYMISAFDAFGFKVPEALTGIIGMVLGFYFGTRSGGADELKEAYQQVAQARKDVETTTKEANEQVQDARSESQQAQSEAAAAQQQAAETQQTADAMSVRAGAAEAQGRLQRRAAFAKAFIEGLLPVLPAGLAPPDAVARVSEALPNAQGLLAVDAAAMTADQLQAVRQTSDSLGGSLAAGTSLMGSLLQAGAPLVAQGAAAAAPAGALALLLCVGTRLGSDQYQRWRARVLGAPITGGLIELGALTPAEAAQALAASPSLVAGFASAADQAQLAARLASVALSDDALQRLWQEYGPDAGDSPPFSGDRPALELGLVQFKQALLALRTRADVTDELVQSVAAAFGPTIPTPLRPPPLTAADVSAMMDAAAAAALNALPSDEQKAAQAAFDALVILVGYARRDQIDLAAAVADIAD